MVQTGIFSNFGKFFSFIFSPLFPLEKPNLRVVTRCAQHPTDIDRHIFVLLCLSSNNTRGKRQYARVMVSQLRDSPPHHHSSIDVSKKKNQRCVTRIVAGVVPYFVVVCSNNEKDKPQNDDDTSLHVFGLIRCYVAERQRKQVEKAIPLEFFLCGVHGRIMNRVHRLSFSRLL